MYKAVHLICTKLCDFFSTFFVPFYNLGRFWRLLKYTMINVRMYLDVTSSLFFLLQINWVGFCNELILCVIIGIKDVRSNTFWNVSSLD